MEELQRQINELKGEVWLLKSAANIPYNVDQAFRERLGLNNSAIISRLANSSKGATTENQAVNEGGAATYSVLKAPDAFLEVTIGGSVKYIPIFT